MVCVTVHSWFVCHTPVANGAVAAGILPVQAGRYAMSVHVVWHTIWYATDYNFFGNTTYSIAVTVVEGQELANREKKQASCVSTLVLTSRLSQ